MSAFDVLGFVIVLCALLWIYRRWVSRLEQRRGVFEKWDDLFDWLKDSVTNQEGGAPPNSDVDDADDDSAG